MEPRGSLRRLGMAVALSFAIVVIPAGMLPVRRALADDTSLGRFGETVRPIRDGQVEMVEEDVRVKVTPKDSTVTCRFVFRNTGEATELLMGFPEEGASPDREMGDDVGIHDFRTWVGGREVPVRREKGGPDLPSSERARQYPFWWTWPVSFKAGETIEVQNSYRVRNTFVSNGEVRTGYILTTGRAWKGPIGRAKVTFEFDGPKPFEISHAFPGLYRFEGDSIVWQWTDFEPAADIEVVFSPMYSLLPYSGEMLGESPEGAPTPEQQRRSDLFWDIVNSGYHRDYARALEGTRRFASLPGLTQEAIEATALLEARFRFLTGDREYGKPMWEKRVETGTAEAEDYYFLGDVYSAAGDGESLNSLYKRLCETAPPSSDPAYGDNRRPLWTVRRWLASVVDTPDPGEFGSGKNSPVIEKVWVEPDKSEAPEAFVLRAVVRDSDGDLSNLNLKVWTTEGDTERVIMDIFEPVRGGGREESPGAIFSLPWPLATAYYRVVATDSAGRIADTGAVKWCIDRVSEWDSVEAPGSAGLVKLRYHGEAGRTLAAAVNSRLGPILEGLGSRLGIRPCNPVIVSFYERAQDEPDAALLAAFLDFPWYVLEADRAPTPERVTVDVLSRVLAHNAGPAWYTKPGSEPNWLLVGLSEYLAGGFAGDGDGGIPPTAASTPAPAAPPVAARTPAAPELTPEVVRAPNAREAWMVALLYAEGKDRFLQFIRKTGEDPHGPDEPLRQVYGFSVEDLDKRWQEGPERMERVRVRRAVVGVLAVSVVAVAMRRRRATARPEPPA